MVTVYDDLINFVLESEPRILTHDHVHLIDKKPTVSMFTLSTSKQNYLVSEGRRNLFYLKTRELSVKKKENT